MKWEEILCWLAGIVFFPITVPLYLSYGIPERRRVKAERWAKEAEERKRSNMTREERDREWEIENARRVAETRRDWELEREQVKREWDDFYHGRGQKYPYTESNGLTWVAPYTVADDTDEEFLYALDWRRRQEL